MFIAAGADKASPITLDEVVNVNNYLGVNPWTYTTVRKVKTLTIKYFPFKDTETSGWFTYNQGTDACAPGTFTPLLTASTGVPTSKLEPSATDRPLLHTTGADVN